MVNDPLIIWFVVMLFFQTIHIFEEIHFEVYLEVGSLKKYLMVAGILVFLNYLPLILILQKVNWGTYLAFLPSIMAIGNGIIHVYGFIKTKSFRGTIGAGIFSGIFLAISGIIVFLQLLSII
jgi:hypothetical protein